MPRPGWTRRTILVLAALLAGLAGAVTTVSPAQAYVEDIVCFTIYDSSGNPIDVRCYHVRSHYLPDRPPCCDDYHRSMSWIDKHGVLPPEVSTELLMALHLWGEAEFEPDPQKADQLRAAAVDAVGRAAVAADGLPLESMVGPTLWLSPDLKHFLVGPQPPIELAQGHLIDAMKWTIKWRIAYALDEAYEDAFGDDDDDDD